MHTHGKQTSQRIALVYKLLHSIIFNVKTLLQIVFDRPPFHTVYFRELVRPAALWGRAEVTLIDRAYSVRLQNMRMYMSRGVISMAYALCSNEITGVGKV